MKRLLPAVAILAFLVLLALAAKEVFELMETIF